MGIISWNGYVNLYKTDLDVFEIIKTRDSWSCCKCDRNIPKNSYCWGKQMQKFCIKCGFEVCGDCIRGLNMLLDSLKEKVNQEEENKEKYLKENLIESL